MPVIKAPLKRRAVPRPSALLMSEPEFVQWSGQEGVRAEWVDGEVIFMSPVSVDHAGLSMFLSQLIGGFVDELELGKLWTEPFQVRLPRQHRRRLPDVFFAFTERLHLVEKYQFNGPPDLIVEIISRDSKTRDRRQKFSEYQAAGVKEYWIVDPIDRRFDAYTLSSAGVFELIPPMGNTTYSILLPGLFFRTEWVWQIKHPKVSALVAQMIRNRKKLRSTRKGRSSDNQS